MEVEKGGRKREGWVRFSEEVVVVVIMGGSERERRKEKIGYGRYN